MEGSSFIPLMDPERDSPPARAPACKPLRVVTIAILLPVLLVAALTVSHQAFRGGSASLIPTIWSAGDVPTRTNGTLSAYSSVVPRSCAGQMDGLTWIQPDFYRPIQVLCQGGWLLMQKRTSSSVNFYRDWMSYRRGFGDETNFWLGNENLHSVTSGGARLRVLLTDANRTQRYAEYSHFTVAGEDQSFRAVFDEYSGTAGDALTYHSGCEFSTFDADHDKNSGNCAERYFGGWWYNSCHYANLNGLYGGSEATGIVWYQWEGYGSSMRSCEMWVQPNE